jgi:EmrB/QacA subfamily drug resistance transporter
MNSMDSRARWLALFVLCLGDLMIVLDVTIVGVALPSIQEDLGFSEASLAWVVNAYLITFGGFLLLGGRLGDLFGHRRLFLIGIAVFTLASALCGFATSQEMLIVARAVQGFGGAVVSAVALSLMMTLFTEPAERAKAMGVFGFVASGGGSLGVLLGGILTDVLDWHWIFLVNVPVGIAVVALSLNMIPSARVQTGAKRLDVAGAVTVTGSLMIAVYAIVNGNGVGWLTGRTLGLLALAGGLFAVFLVIETRTSSPLMPLSLFRLRNLSTANVVGVLWSAAMFAWFFLSALYLQLVLGYSPLEVGLAFLPGNLIMGALSIGLSAKLVMRFGIRPPLAVGLLLAGLGLALFARAPVDGTFVVDVLPAMLLLGLGAGMAFNPVLLAAMNDVKPEDAGLASGVVNTSFMMGGALGLAVLASLAASRTDTLLASGEGQLAALTGGYHLAFFVGALFAVTAAVLGAVLLRPRPVPTEEGPPRLEPQPCSGTGQEVTITYGGRA